MRKLCACGLLILLIGLACSAWAMGEAYEGKFVGTAKLLYEMPVYGTSMNYDGTAEVTITKVDDDSYRVDTLTRFQGMPESEDTQVYNYQGGALVLHDVSDDSGVTLEQNDRFNLSGNKLIGEVVVTGKMEGQVQTKSTSTFDVTRQ